VSVLGGAPFAHCEKSKLRPGAAIAALPLASICTVTCDPWPDGATLTVNSPPRSRNIDVKAAANIVRVRRRAL
jgi:hypothetical protein